MDAQPSRASLMGLPRELRDHILSYLLVNVQPQPLYPPLPHARERTKYDITLPPKQAMGGGLVTGQHFVNRQFLSEARENSRILYSPRPPTLELDLIVKGYLFHPTWTILPAFIARDTPVDLKVNLRLFGTESFRSSGAWPRQPGAEFRPLFELLKRFLLHGPSLRSAGAEDWNVREKHDLYCIGTLSVDITCWDLYGSDTWPAILHKMFSKLKGLAVDGIIWPFVRTVKVRTACATKAGDSAFEREWEVRNGTNPETLWTWEDSGYHALLRDSSPAVET